MPTPTYTLIASSTVGAGGTSTITFSSIPNTYTDLCIVLSTRQSRSSFGSNIGISFNGSTTNFSARYLEGLGGGTPGSATFARFAGVSPAANATANTFGSTNIYIPNYAGSTNKSYSADSVSENNSSTFAEAAIELIAGLWSDTSAITSVALSSLSSDNFVQYSTAYLYGIIKS